MINHVPTWGEWGLVLVRLKDCSLNEPKVLELQQIDAHALQAKSNIKQERMKIFLKLDRDQTEVFSTSNYNGYVTV